MTTKITTIAIAAAFTLLGCKKTTTDIQNFTPTAADQRAQEWFDEQNRKPELLHVKTVLLSEVTPFWGRTRYYAAENTLVAPVQADDAAANPAKYIVMLENKAGEIGSGYYCFVASQDNKPEVTPSLLGNTVPQNFNGTIVKFNLDGSLITAEEYANGTATNIPLSTLEQSNDVYMHLLTHKN